MDEKALNVLPAGIAIAGVGFWTYFVLSMLITGTYGAAVIMLGDSLFDHDYSRILVLAVFFVALARGVWWWRRSTQEKEAGLRAS